MDANHVTFDPSTMHANNPSERANIVNLVIARAPAGAATATVVSGWHTSRGDRRSHCTVDYYDAAGSRISREHIV